MFPSRCFHKCEITNICRHVFPTASAPATRRQSVSLSRFPFPKISHPRRALRRPAGIIVVSLLVAASHLHAILRLPSTSPFHAARTFLGPRCRPSLQVTVSHRRAPTPPNLPAPHHAAASSSDAPRTRRYHLRPATTTHAKPRPLPALPGGPFTAPQSQAALSAPPNAGKHNDRGSVRQTHQRGRHLRRFSHGRTGKGASSCSSSGSAARPRLLRRMRCSLMPARARLLGRRHDTAGVDTIMPDVGGDGEQGTAIDHHRRQRMVEDSTISEHSLLLLRRNGRRIGR